VAARCTGELEIGTTRVARPTLRRKNRLARPSTGLTVIWPLISPAFAVLLASPSIAQLLKGSYRVNRRSIVWEPWGGPNSTIGDCHAPEESQEDRAQARRLQKEAKEAPSARRRASSLKGYFVCVAPSRPGRMTAPRRAVATSRPTAPGTDCRTYSHWPRCGPWGGTGLRGVDPVPRAHPSSGTPSGQAPGPARGPSLPCLPVVLMPRHPLHERGGPDQPRLTGLACPSPKPGPGRSRDVRAGLAGSRAWYEARVSSPSGRRPPAGR
jgi:hypothetical protein